MALLKTIFGIFLIAAGCATLIYFFRPKMVKKMIRMSSGIYRGSTARRELGDAVYNYSIFPRVMSAVWLGPILLALLLIGFGLSLL